MRRRGNNNCSSACTLGGRKALLYESTNRENEKKEREREREREGEGERGERRGKKEIGIRARMRASGNN